MRTWRRATWLVAATIAFWLLAFALWSLQPSDVAADMPAGLGEFARNGEFALGMAAAAMTIAAALVIWMFTMPPGGRPPSE